MTPTFKLSISKDLKQELAMVLGRVSSIVKIASAFSRWDMYKLSARLAQRAELADSDCRLLWTVLKECPVRERTCLEAFPEFASFEAALGDYVVSVRVPESREVPEEIPPVSAVADEFTRSMREKRDAIFRHMIMPEFSPRGPQPPEDSASAEVPKGVCYKGGYETSLVAMATKRAELAIQVVKLQFPDASPAEVEYRAIELMHFEEKTLVRILEEFQEKLRAKERREATLRTHGLVSDQG